MADKSNYTSSLNEEPAPDRKNVTIKDIARKLNLHHSTVSRALRNHPEVGARTREKVLALARDWDYHPNTIAQSFRQKKSKTIGVIVPDFRNDFFAHEISGIEEIAYNAGYDIMICQSNESYEREMINVRTLVSNQVCGALICVSQETKNGDHFKVFQTRGIPLVFFDRVCQKQVAVKIVADDFGGAFKATEHLIQAGYKRIAHLAGPRNLSVSDERLKGYMAALQKHRLPLDWDLVVFGGFKKEDGTRGFRKLRERGNLPDAIFSVNDPVAIGAMMQIKAIGLKIPRDVALVGFGDNEISSLVDPSLTTVKQTPFEIGKIASTTVIEQIENSKIVSTNKTEIIKTELVIRESG